MQLAYSTQDTDVWPRVEGRAAMRSQCRGNQALEFAGHHGVRVQRS
jgi:hypothetical protein